jgi:glutaminyl-peptide cyclotransferase
MRLLVVTLALVACSCGPSTQAENAVPEYSYQVIHTYPHDRGAFTEGLFYENGFLYESTGLNLQSTLRKVKLETGEVVQKFDWPEAYFGEGIVKWHDQIYQLSYKNQIGFIFDFATFAKKGEFQYQGQGWAFTTDGKQIYMDGSRDVQAAQSDAEIRILDPATLKETATINVTADGVPVKNLNELEWVKGEIYANIWQTYKIARIDPKSGKVVGWIDLTGILSSQDQQGTNELNGIAYDAAGDRLFVTGKNWPKLFEIKLVKSAR